MQLYTGNKNYSSWSLRAWLMLDKNNINFDDIALKLFTDHFYDTLEGLSPTKKVPLLIDGDVAVWESLAICEYINETYLSGKAWPEHKVQRATARAMANEMHAGFFALRNELPMNIRATRRISLSQQAHKDIKRIEQIWANQFKQYNGWLFGDWSIVDAMYAPVVLRFKTYGITLNQEATAYMDHVLNCDSLNRWITMALAETDIVMEDEAGEEIV